MQLKAMTIPSAPCCKPDASVVEVRQIMAAHRAHQVLVVDAGRRLLGRVRHRDLPDAAQAGSDDSTSIAALLRTPAFWLRDDASVAEVLQLMHYQRLQRVPISDERDAIYGLIDRTQLADAFPALAAAWIPPAPAAAPCVNAQRLPTQSPAARAQPVAPMLLALPIKGIA